MKKIFILILAGVLLPVLAFADCPCDITAPDEVWVLESNNASTIAGYDVYTWESYLAVITEGLGTNSVSFFAVERQPEDPCTMEISVQVERYEPACTNTCEKVINVLEEGRCPVVEDGKIFTIPSTFPADALAYANDFFTDLNLIIVLSAGLPVAFWGIKKVIGLVRFR
ncbi:unnamed protein product [marine sediment metagenome]|uniref:Uncharacterized protein n=1 Tax=marine sediment metagenome TaxID=412755 RepID=X1K4T9_9ZZZZ